MFKDGFYKEAIKYYSRALHTCPYSYFKERSIMYSNRAACKLHMVRVCESSLPLQLRMFLNCIEILFDAHNLIQLIPYHIFLISFVCQQENIAHDVPKHYSYCMFYNIYM